MHACLTVLRIPVLVIAVGDQVVLFAPSGCVRKSELDESGFVERHLHLARERAVECERAAPVRLFRDYITGEELPVASELCYVERAVQGRERAAAVPVRFKVALYDAFWNAEKRVEAEARLLVYSAAARLEVERHGLLVKEKARVGGREYWRTLSPTSVDFHYTSRDEELERAVERALAGARCKASSGSRR